MEKYRIVPRLEKWADEWRPCLFLPDDQQPPYIGHYCQREGHGMASRDYYRDTRPPNAEAIKLAESYARDIPGAVIRRRITH